MDYQSCELFGMVDMNVWEEKNTHILYLSHFKILYHEKKLDGIFNGLLKESLFFERCQLVLLLGKRNNMEKCDKWEY